MGRQRRSEVVRQLLEQAVGNLESTSYEGGGQWDALE